MKYILISGFLCICTHTHKKIDVPMNIFLSHANRSQIRSANSPISHTNIFLSGVRKKDYFRIRKEYFCMRKEYFRMIRNSDREARTPTPRSV